MARTPNDITTPFGIVNNQTGEVHQDPNDPNNFFNKVGSYIDEFLTGKRTQQRDFEYSKKLQDYQNKAQWDMMKWEANYNSTPNQLARWVAAGGNANAFFGGNQVAAAPNGSASSSGGVGSSVGVLQNALNPLIASGINASKAYWENQKTKAETEGKQIENGTLREMLETNIELTKANIWKAQQDGNLSEWKAKEIKTLLPMTYKKTESEIKQIEAQCSLLLAETQQALANAKYLDQRRKTEVYNTLREKWKKEFSEKWNIDPDSDRMQAVIQTILGGHGQEIIGELFNFVEDGLRGVTDEIKKDMPDIVKKEKRLGDLLAEKWGKEKKNKYNNRFSLIQFAKETAMPWKF